MSTAYGYYCKTCNETSALEDRAYRQAEKFIELRKEVESVFDAFNAFDKLNIDFDMTMDFNIAYAQEGNFLKFLSEHRNHEIYVHDEYGYNYHKKDGKYIRIEEKVQKK
jgi:hypothetical protein